MAYAYGIILMACEKHNITQMYIIYRINSEEIKALYQSQVYILFLKFAKAWFCSSADTDTANPHAYWGIVRQ